ncbi:hypothetical protein ACU4GD_19540 [Cupriavidus basilensis]
MPVDIQVIDGLLPPVRHCHDLRRPGTRSAVRLRTAAWCHGAASARAEGASPAKRLSA